VLPYAPMPLPPARTRFLAAALLPILVATLWPFPGHEPEGFISCIACGAHATSDVLLNIILFVPLGAALALHVRSIPRCALSAALLSATIELVRLGSAGGSRGSTGRESPSPRARAPWRSRSRIP